MEQIELKLNGAGEGFFELWENNERLGEMAVAIADGMLTVFHTGVVPKAEGRGLAKKMLETMVAHARSHNLKIIPLCPYVQAQFRRHAEVYADVWKKDGIEE